MIGNRNKTFLYDFGIKNNINKFRNSTKEWR